MLEGGGKMKGIFAVVAIFAFVALITIGMWYAMAFECRRLYSEGAAAKHAGAPATANPYVHRDAMSASQWLRGWVETESK